MSKICPYCGSYNISVTNGGFKNDVHQEAAAKGALAAAGGGVAAACGGAAAVKAAGVLGALGLKAVGFKAAWLALGALGPIGLAAGVAIGAGCAVGKVYAKADKDNKYETVYVCNTCHKTF